MDQPVKSGGQNGRSMRQKGRHTYLSDIDDEIDGKWNFDLDEKLTSDKFVGKNKFYADLKGSEVNVEYFQKNGFKVPILVREKTGLGLRTPSENFTVSDVKRCVGSRRVLDVVDVNTQKGLEMTLKEWVNYYEDAEQHKHRLLNVISLEFSHTRLEDYVDQPRVVSELDWVNSVWPWYYKELQTQAANTLDSMLYPKVQKYCLMSVGGCYTDFHIDMGGTSVWYHILRGKKVFWFIPPTEKNLNLYINWTLSAKQGDIFFGDMVDACYRITLEAGWTFFIPTGWIHAVYTPVDSLVFGGNFLHSFNMPLQLGILDVEIKTHVPVKFRYPFFKELHWYALERYVSCLMGIEHRERSKGEILLENGEVESVEELPLKTETDENYGNPNACELESASSEFKDEVFSDLTVSASLPLNLMCDDEVVSTDDVKKPCSDVLQAKSNERAGRACDGKMPTGFLNGSSYDKKLSCSVVELQSVDKHEGKLSDLKQKRGCRSADVTSKMSTAKLTRHEIEGLEAVVKWLESLAVNKRGVPKDIPEPDLLLSDVRKLLEFHKKDDHEEAITGEMVLKWPPRKQPKRRKAKASLGDGPKRVSTAAAAAAAGSGVKRRRRVRCKQCEPCTRPDCRECVFCLDLKKYGGPQKMKQTCVSRRCLAPMLSRETVCDLCSQGNSPRAAEFLFLGDVPDGEDWSSWLLECRVCFEVVHPACLRERHPEITHSGVFDEDFPSSWDCSRCCERGLQGQCRSRQKLTTEKSYRVSTSEHGAVERVRCQTTAHQCEDLDDETRNSSTPASSYSKPKVTVSKVNNISPPTKTFDAKERHHKRDDSRSCEREQVVKKKVAKIDKTKRCRSPDWSFVTDEPLATVRVNSRGREITLPRRYLI